VRTKPQPGEIWFAELGMVEKSRPVLVFAMPEDTDARALAIVAPLTSQIREMRGEFYLGKPRWLPKVSAINLQGISSMDHSKLSRKLGILTNDQLNNVKDMLRDLLNL